MKFLFKRVKITDVKIGELVRGCDIVNEQDVYRKVLNVMRPIVEHDQQVRISTATGSLTTSKTHPTAKFQDGKIIYIQGGDIRLNDYVVVEGKPNRVLSISSPNVSTQYADFSIDQTENYYAGDSQDQLILAHNSATVTFPIWHAQFEDLIVLKNNQGTDETRVRHMDYSVVLSGLFWKRLLEGKDITLFDPSQVPDLYEAFYSDIDLFDRLYEQYEERKDLKVKRLPAAVVIRNMIVKERTDTGRIYMVFIDNVQRQGPFDTKVHPIYQSNLCIAGDSKVVVTDGADELELSMEELAFVYSSGDPGLFIKSVNDDGQICFSRLENVWATKETSELIEIEADGRVLRCTPDHQILTMRGWIEAQHLLEDDVLVFGNTK